MEIDMSEPARILYVVEDMWGCAWYRAHTPAMELIRRGHVAVMHDKIHEPSLDMCDVVVFQRPSHAASARAIEYALSRGKRVVVDIDDDLWTIHPSNPAFPVWNGTGRLDVLRFCLSAAHMVTVATDDLVSVVRPMNRNVTVIPNMLPAGHWPPQGVRRKEPSPLVVGWAGSSSHSVDLDVLAGTVETLLDRYPNVEVAIAGMEKVPFRPHERLRFVKPVMIEEYPLTLSKFDIGMIPLADSRFNRCKSDLKFLEYSMIGIPSVASKVAPYEGSVNHGVNGFLARNPKDWLKHLSRLIEDPELRDSMGQAARAFAEARTVEKNIGLWESAYGIGGGLAPGDDRA
jgi:glycosyltransferase involved in cell wall biosynthesis